MSLGEEVLLTSCVQSSTLPREDSEVDDAEAVGESFGESIGVLATVEAVESSVVVLRLAALERGSAVIVLILFGRSEM